MLALLPLLSFLASSVAAAMCNGHSELCNRKYSNVTFMGSHDSAFVGTGLADNQETSVADQLKQGVRFLQIQTHDNNGTIHLCHTLCLLEDAGPLKDYLTTIKTFLDGNPDEVVTLLVTNPDKKTGADFDGVFKSAGADIYAFAPADNLSVDAWPTMVELISSGKRLVVFMDYPADNSVPYILDEFNSYIFETPFDTTNPAFPQCQIDRPAGASPAGRMSLVNHFLDTNLSGITIPNHSEAPTTNGAASILAQANICTGLYKRNPNFILLDWISIGDAMTVQNQLNGVPNNKATVPTNSSTNSTTMSPQRNQSSDSSAQDAPSDSPANSPGDHRLQSPSKFAAVLACTLLFLSL